jgi:DNA repair exonuclease SbcCD ATPase subunit
LLEAFVDWLSRFAATVARRGRAAQSTLSQNALRNRGCGSKMPEPAPKLKLPRIQKVSLRRFSLFAANPDAEFSCGPGVMCLVGANGVGKSTLLSAINFCLTGTVPEPSRTFESMDEYYKFTRAFSGSYFRGRIAGRDEDDAEIGVSFRIGSFDYEVRRGLFEPDELRALAISDCETHLPVITTTEMPRRERHRVYMNQITNHTGFESFEEFVFLHHFAFTFDEYRGTLFWNTRVMERVLYRAFGFEPGMAKRADGIRREIQHEDSRVRNYQWEATRMRKRINEIRAQTQAVTGAQQTYDTLLADHEGLSRQFDEESKTLRDVEDAIRDANLQLAERSVRETALREEYARFFGRQFERRPPLPQHPLIAESLAKHVCGLCGASTDKAHAAITANAAGATCPLCNSALDQKVWGTEDSDRLKKIDRELSLVRQSIKDVHKTLEGLRKNESEARRGWETTKEKLDEFDRKNSTTLDGLRKLLTHSGGEVTLTDYREQLAILQREKKTAQERRDELKKHLMRLQKDLEQHYLQVEESFVPRFANLAQGFLGMDLSVQMEARTTDDLKLIVSVRGAPRRQQQHLSESQRFFLDIAFRMALTQHMSAPGSKGGMIIDTPEGSLDIAYEKRAGDMLAKFASSGHQIIMTANLNSSQLLLALARDCGRSQMTLCRMMDWAELSDVQQQEESLFEGAYRAIEEAMHATKS